jgi:hypothetical protein
VTCHVCHQTKPETDFSKHGEGRRSICKSCDNASRRERDFGITELEFKVLQRANGGLCWCCGERHAIVLDHEHGEEDQYSRHPVSELQQRNRAARRQH